MTQAQLAAIVERCEKATPGEWVHRIDNSWAKPDRIIETVCCGNPNHGFVIIRCEDTTKHYKQGRGDEENFNFMANAHQDIPALVQALTEARATIEAQAREIAELQEHNTAFLKTIADLRGTTEQLEEQLDAAETQLAERDAAILAWGEYWQHKEFVHAHDVKLLAFARAHGILRGAE